MDDTVSDAVAKALREGGGRYVVDAGSRPVAALLTLEEYEHYLDLLDDEEDSQDEDLRDRLDSAAVALADVERTSLRDYLRQRSPDDASLQGRTS